MYYRVIPQYTAVSLRAQLYGFPIRKANNRVRDPPSGTKNTKTVVITTERFLVCALGTLPAFERKRFALPGAFRQIKRI